MLNMRVTAIEMIVVHGIIPKDLKKKTGGIGNQRNNQDHPEYEIVKIGLNTLKT